MSDYENYMKKNFDYKKHYIEAFDVEPVPHIDALLSEKEEAFIKLATNVLRKQMVYTLATKGDYGQNEEEAIKEWDIQLAKLFNGECR